MSEAQSWVLSCELGLSGLKGFPVIWIQAVLTQRGTRSGTCREIQIWDAEHKEETGGNPQAWEEREVVQDWVGHSNA